MIHVKLIKIETFLKLNGSILHQRMAILCCISRRYNSCVAYLLSHGADPMLQDNLKRSALHHAVGSGKVQVVRQLLQDSTRVNTATGPQILRDFLQQDHAAGRVR